MRRQLHVRFKAAIGAVTMLLLGVGAHGNAIAADLDNIALRGSYLSPPAAPGYSEWDGIYFGGTFSASSMNTDFGTGTRSLLQYILRNTIIENEANVSDLTVLPKTSTQSTGYGGFIGYNFQIEPELVLGLELTYNKVSASAGASDSIARSFETSKGLDNVFVSSQAALRLNDYGTLRARAGYVIGQFMPYAMVGFAVGRADVSRSATVTISGADNLSPTTAADARQNIFAYGVAAGLGVDVAIMPNIFLRGEWEFVQFAPINDVKMNMNSGRVGLGLKF